jgi:VWFA-related protein
MEAEMNWNPWRLVFLAGGVALGYAVLHGQQPKSVGAPKDSGAIFLPDTRLVVCHTTVQDKSGHLVTNLNQSAFTVLENGVKQEIQLFRHEDTAVSMGLIIDNSGSMRDKRGSVEAAALALVQDSNPDDEVFVVNFNEKVYFDNPHGKDFTTDRSEMQEALTHFDSRGDSAIREAIVNSIEWMKKAHKEKHVLVVVTDGVDDASHVKLEEVVRSAQQSEAIIYVIGLLAGEEKSEAREARRQFSSLAEATGGEAFYPYQLSDVDSIAHRVAHDIRGQYTIGYKPSNEALDGAFRKIKVTVKAVGDPKARTRTGYYAATNQGSSPTAHSQSK